MGYFGKIIIQVILSFSEYIGKKDKNKLVSKIWMNVAHRKHLQIASIGDKLREIIWDGLVCPT